VMNAIFIVIKSLVVILLKSDNSGISKPVLIINFADFLNRIYGFSGQQEELQKPML
jgi:hypothetical protein